MACPFFVPIAKLETGGWLHPSRLPLGAGWEGHCSAPGHEGSIPSEEELQQFCNLGYATKCPRLPNQRMCDAVRFSVARDRGSQILFTFVCESGHRPTACGTLEYDVGSERWLSPHPGLGIQRLAESYLVCYLERSRRGAGAALENMMP